MRKGEERTDTLLLVVRQGTRKQRPHNISNPCLTGSGASGTVLTEKPGLASDAVSSSLPEMDQRWKSVPAEATGCLSCAKVWCQAFKVSRPGRSERRESFFWSYPVRDKSFFLSPLPKQAPPFSLAVEFSPNYIMHTSFRCSRYVWFSLTSEQDLGLTMTQLEHDHFSLDHLSPPPSFDRDANFRSKSHSSNI